MIDFYDIKYLIAHFNYLHDKTMRLKRKLLIPLVAKNVRFFRRLITPVPFFGT